LDTELIYGYAIFVEEEFAGIFYYIASGSQHNMIMTKALQSNPKIVLDDDEDIPFHLYRYSVFVEDEYVEKIYLVKHIDGHDVAKINAALQSDPTLVWIESDTLPKSNTKWSYIDNTLTLIEE
jgi:hypothetical protein